MRIPAWATGRPAIFAGGVLLVALLAAWWLRAHDARVRREAIAAERVEALEAARVRQDSVIAAKDSALAVAQAATDTVTIYAAHAGGNYQRERARVNTAAPQPAGIPAGSVVVPVSFVRAADSMAVAIPQLLAAMASERAASEARIAAGDSLRVLLEEEVRQLKIVINASRPSATDRIKWAALGAGIMAAGALVLGN